MNYVTNVLKVPVESIPGEIRRRMADGGAPSTEKAKDTSDKGATSASSRQDRKLKPRSEKEDK